MHAAASFDSRIIQFCARALARSPAALRSLDSLAKLAFHRRQALRRQAALREGLVVPPVLIASVTRRCNLDCAGCYSKALRPAGAAAELSDERFLGLLREAMELGVGTLMLAGGEPLLRPALLAGAAELSGSLSPVFTNGTLFDASWAELFSRGSLVPVFSIEGDSGRTAARRGGGVHEAVVEAAAAVRERGSLFGLSVTLTSRNFDEILSPAFLERVDRLGAAALFLVEYVPSRAGTEELALGPARHAALAADGRLDGLPYPVLRLPGDESIFGGCLAAGRGFLHLSPEGAVEACPFAPYSDSSAAVASLREALGSPLMAAIRERHGELAESGEGCALAGKGGWIASLGACAAREESAAVPA